MLFGMITGMVNTLKAVPANPLPVEVEQPNGEKITVSIKGDEFINWIESLDGYTLMYDDNKTLVYATLNEKGNLVPSSIVASDINKRSSEELKAIADIPKKLFYSEAQQEALLQVWQIADQAKSAPAPKATTGKAKAICAIIQFPDKELTYSQDEFYQLMNQVGYNKGGQKGSVRDYYFENSYGQLELEVTVAGPYTSNFNHSYYENRASELVIEAARKAFKEEDINPEDYDNDKNYYIDTFHLIFAGYGAESTGEGIGNIWSHKSSFSQITFGNVFLNTYSCSPELRGASGTNLTYIGVICHELCHVFGAPDFYDTNYATGGSYDGTGSWDLMANGSWNGGGAVPSHINMYQKIDFGWVDAKELVESEAIMDMPNSAENPVAYIVKTTKPNDYYVLENRQKVGYDAYVPGTGLLIYHVNILSSHIKNNNPNNTHPQRVYPVHAGATYDIPSASKSSYNVNSARTPFGEYSKKTAFSSTSKPQMFTWNGSAGLAVEDKPISDIREDNKMISFLFGDAKYPFVIELKVGVKNDQVAIRWSHEEPATPIKHYKVFRNGKHIIDTNEDMYVEIVSQIGTYVYGVCAVFEDDSESDVVEITAEVTVASISDNMASTFSIYPNPVNSDSEFIINLGESNKQTEIYVFDLSGRLMFSQTTNDQVTPLNLSLNPGTYLVKISNEDFSETRKLIIK